MSARRSARLGLKYSGSPLAAVLGTGEAVEHALARERERDGELAVLVSWTPRAFASATPAGTDATACSYPAEGIWMTRRFGSAPTRA